MKKLLLSALPLSMLLFACNQSIRYSVETPKSGQPVLVKNEPAPQNNIRQRDGKCYKNCIAPDRYEPAFVSFPIYTGTDPDAPVRLERIMTEAPKNQWVRRPNGEIYLVQTPATTKDVRVLADTVYFRDFRMSRFEIKKLAEKGGFMRETEVVCSDERTPSLFLQISTALKSYGYMEEPTPKWDSKFSEAIQQFQKDNSLPVGDLNLETLHFMGI